MPKIVHVAPKYRRHKASGQAVVTLGGQDFYLGPYRTRASRAEYDRLVGEWLAAGRRAPKANDADALTIAELAAAYLRFANGYYRKNGRPTRTIERVRLALKLLRKSYGHTAAREFGPLALQAVQQTLVREGKSRPYINCLIEEVRRIFKWGVAQEMVSAATYQALAAVPGLRKGRTEAREPDPIKPVSDAVVEATLPHLPQIVADMVRLQRLTGMRPGEVCIVRPCDVDRSGEVWQYRPHEHKTEHHGRERVVFLGPKAQAILLPYLLRDAQSYCFSPAEREKARSAERRANRQTPMTPSQRRRRRKRHPQRQPGDCYTVGTYGNAIRRACAVAWPAAENLTPDERRQWNRAHCWTPNRLRHAAATEIRARYGLESAQTVLGHAHANVTEVYAERDASRAAAIMREVG
jgi:integrase